MGQPSTPETWAAWTSSLTGDEGEDLAEVFRNVRRDKTLATQMKWARDWRTRAFCDLGLHLIYEHHVRRSSNGRPEELRIFANLQARDLQNHAQLGFFDLEQAEELDVDRFTSTWGQQGAFSQDLISYLFRPAPSLRRITQGHLQMTEMAQELPLGDWVRWAAKTELDWMGTDPVPSLQVFVEAVLPQDRDVRAYAQRLRRLRLQRWADLYERIFPAYGVSLRPIEDLDWLTFADRVSIIIGGTFQRMQTHTTGSTSGIDGDLLGQMLVEYLPALLTIEAGEIPLRRVQ